MFVSLLEYLLYSLPLQNFKTDASPSQPTLASTILFLSKRNGLYHSRHIIHELKNRVVDVNLNHTLQSDEALHSREQLTGT